MTFAQYAKHRGVSGAAVTYAVQNARITAHQDEGGKRYLIAEEADVQWLARTDRDRGVPAQKAARAEEAEASAAPTLPPAAPPAAQVSEPEEPAGAGDNEERTPPLYESKAKKEAYFARAAKLKYETDMGKLVPVAEVSSRWAKVISATRTKILGVPSKAKQRIPELTTAGFLMLESIVREALEDLASGAD